MKLDLPAGQLVVLREILDAHLPEAEIWAHGSRVKGQAHEGSDLDLVVRNPVEPSKPQAGLDVLRGALRESNLPILVEALDWARLPESFREEIEREHVVMRAALAGNSAAR